jgi:acyl-CoA thioester hydrolase
MFTTETSLRIHYALTDQMGIVYYGHYAQFYEIGRTEAIRQIGFTYKETEAMGIIMPVVEMSSRFLRPAKYDDLITIKTIVKEMPTHHKIVFHSEIYNENGKLLNTGETTLFFIDAKTMKRCQMPERLQQRLSIYFGG